MADLTLCQFIFLPDKPQHSSFLGVGPGTQGCGVWLDDLGSDAGMAAMGGYRRNTQDLCSRHTLPVPCLLMEPSQGPCERDTTQPILQIKKLRCQKVTWFMAGQAEAWIRS